MRHATLLGKRVRRPIYYIPCKITAAANKRGAESICRGYRAPGDGRETCLQVRVRR